MKRFTLFTLCLGLALSVMQTPTVAQAQQTASQAKKSIGLIDMAHLFKEYKKFADLREQLRNEIKATDDAAKKMAESIKATQAKLKAGTYAEGSAEYTQLETKLISDSTKFEAFRKTQQQKFLRRESKIYKEVYLEVVGAVGQYAKYYNYDVIVRFSRNAVDETNNAQELIQNMNKQVVWHNSGIDITDQVLDYLNKQYAASTKTASGSGNPKK